MSELALDLLFQAPARLAEVRASKISKRNYSLALFFLEMRYLCRKESHFEKRNGTSAIPFHAILTHCSPRYATAFKLVERLHIKLRPNLISTARLFIDFNVWNGGGIYFPCIKEELHWLVEQELNTENISKMAKLVSEYNFSSYHEVMHAIFARLVPPMKGAVSDDYLLFHEALALTEDWYLSSELGEPINNILWRAGVIRRSSPNKIHKQYDDQFINLCFSHLAHLHGLSKAAAKRRLAPTVSFLDSEYINVNPEYLRVSATNWKKHHPKIEYAASMQEFTSRLNKLELFDFSLDFLLRKKNISALSDWKWWLL